MKNPRARGTGIWSGMEQGLADFHHGPYTFRLEPASAIIVAKRRVISDALTIFPCVLEGVVAVITFVTGIPAMAAAHFMARVPVTGFIAIINIGFVAVSRMGIRGLHAYSYIYIRIHAHTKAQLSVCRGRGKRGCGTKGASGSNILQ